MNGAINLLFRITVLLPVWVDTKIVCVHLSEVHNATKEVQARVQARGGEVSLLARYHSCAGGA